MILFKIKRNSYNWYDLHACCTVCRATLLVSIAVVVTVALAALVSCAPVGPNYKRIDPNSPQQWHSKLGTGLSVRPFNPAELAHWWVTLHDTELQSLEKRAVEGNLNVKIALSRIRQARAQRGVVSAGLFPGLNVGGSVTKNRSSANSGTGMITNLYKGGFDAGWELDIFGGTRRSVEVAQANLEATQESLHSVLVSLLAEVAINYVELRTYQDRLSVIRTNIEIQKQSYQLNLSRYKAGVINELAVQQSLYNLEHTRSAVPALQTGIAAAKNRLAVLLGQRPGSLHNELANKMPIPVSPVTVAIGIPADTLRHRPDVRMAERQLAAATAQIGVAKSYLYPRFSLNGTIGLESLSRRSFFEQLSRTWSIGPSVSWNVFDAGAIRQNIKLQTARQHQALIHYQSVVLKAQEEVENALVSYAKEQLRRDSLQKAVTAAKNAYKLARNQYKAGLVDFSTVLDAQRSLQSFQDELVTSNGMVTLNLIRLYKALGGGWECNQPSKIASGK